MKRIELCLVFFISGISTTLLIYIIFLPESPRWDLCKGNIESAKKTFQRIAKSNGIDISQTNFEHHFDCLKQQIIQSKDDQQL